MPVSVSLDFVPEPGFTKLHIYEAVSQAGAPGTMIETVTVDPANPPTRYTTNMATSVADWFSIQWEDAKGALSPMSEPIQGGTSTLINAIVQRVLLRDPSMNEKVVTQEAEEAVKKFFKTTDPYSIAEADAVGNTLTGLVYLTMARTLTFAIIAGGGSSDSYTAGLVSQKAESGATKSRDMIDWLLKYAGIYLGYNISFVMLLEEIDVTGINTRSAIQHDQSRLALTVNFE